jgi:glucokinase
VLLAGIDLGGTNVRVGVAYPDAPERPTAVRSGRTPRSAGVDVVIDVMDQLLGACLADVGAAAADIVALGCAVPGIVDTGTGTVVDAANLEGWRDIPFKEQLYRRFTVPCAIENDVNAAALAEYLFGAGHGCESLVFMTVSTGVAAGIVVSGRLLRGAHNAAGEIAYIIPEKLLLESTWGHSGCLEESAAGMGLAKAWSEFKSVPYDPNLAREVLSSAREGDAEANKLVEQSADYLALAALAVCTVVDPEVLVLGGSIARNAPTISERIASLVRNTILFPPEVRMAELDGEAPIVGALSLASELASDSRRSA